MNVTIYHNPDCGTSRSVLKLIRVCGIEPTVIEYLKSPPSEPDLIALLDCMGMTAREVLREKGTPYAALGLGNPGKTDDELRVAIRQHPILLNRPIVVTEEGAKLCRPSDVALDMLPEPPCANVTRDDGTPFLRDREVGRPALPDLALAMEAAGLPADDLGDPERTFFHYRRLDNEGLGWGGFELYGTDVLLRSMAIEARFRREGNGRNLAALLTRRAYDRGARQAYAFTDKAESRAFFEAAGFKIIERGAAPVSILGTRQAAGLCPSSANLLTKRIAFS